MMLMSLRSTKPLLVRWVDFGDIIELCVVPLMNLINMFFWTTGGLLCREIRHSDGEGEPQWWCHRTGSPAGLHRSSPGRDLTQRTQAQGQEVNMLLRLISYYLPHLDLMQRVTWTSGHFFSEPMAWCPCALELAWELLQSSSILDLKEARYSMMRSF